MASVLLADADKVELARRLEDVSKTVQGLFLSSDGTPPSTRPASILPSAPDAC